MWHHVGGEELDAAHDLHMRDHSAHEAADQAPDVEFLAHLPESLEACFWRVENRHRLASLLIAKLHDDVATHHARNRIGVLHGWRQGPETEAGVAIGALRSPFDSMVHGCRDRIIRDTLWRDPV
jgi:hypothetical protein